jgi:hypothetical protein
MTHRDAEIVAAGAARRAGHALGHAVGGEAVEAPAQEKLVARGRGLELQPDAVRMQEEVAAVVPELRQEVGVAVRAAVGRGLEAPGEADAHLARREDAVERIGRAFCREGEEKT